MPSQSPGQKDNIYIGQIHVKWEYLQCNLLWLIGEVADIVNCLDEQQLAESCHTKCQKTILIPRDILLSNETFDINHVSVKFVKTTNYSLEELAHFSLTRCL